MDSLLVVDRAMERVTCHMQQIFRSKFDIIAPVWFEIALADDGTVTLSGKPFLEAGRFVGG